jgi:hypothetical protein
MVPLPSPSIIQAMQRDPSARQYIYSSFFLMVLGWGGLALMILVLDVPPFVWARWGFFALWFTALSGTALPAAYFLNLRFPSYPPAEPNSIVRQALWVGVYGCILAWLQLGHVMAFWMWMSLAGGLAGVEYLIRLRERSRWHPPADLGESGRSEGGRAAADDQYWLGDDESPQ